LPSVGEAARGLRDRPLGRILILAAILLAALLVSRSCGATNVKVSEEQAIAIAKRQVSFTPNNIMIRLNKHGFKSRPFWNVSLSIKQPDGRLDDVTVVVIDASSGRVTEVRTA
jgi:hypothetical protein